jgi:cytochrome c oxidase cbb3-type subunit IV
MDSLIALYPLLKTLWVVWFFLLFLGMVFWVMRRSKKRHYEQLGTIPLRDDPPGPPR